MISLRRLFAITGKELRHVVRDVRTLFLVTVTPAFMLLTLAYVFSFDVEHFNLVVLDQDKSDLSRQYLADLSSDGTFRIVASVDHYKEIDAWLQAGDAHAALIIPPGTEASLRAYRPSPVQVILDGVDAIAASQALGQLYARTNAYAVSLLSTHPDLSIESGVLDVRSQAWYNPSLKSLYSMVPGLIAVVLAMPALALALALTREKELGSFEGLSATPVRGIEYLGGKMLAYVGFSLAGALLVVAVAIAWFRVPFRGDLLVFLEFTACYFLASFGLSMVVANFAKSQQVAMLVVILAFFIPSFFLAGLILPVDTSSAGARLASSLLPATHFIAICRGVFLKGLGIADLYAPVCTLLAIGGVMLALSLALFCKWVE
ncbi:MAG: ABC transporter permease [Thermoflexales bacterium]|nr:ABC transporter permease [Thermoflexales bacterium]